MDGDPSQEDRIRLIGRLFFFTCARRLILRSFAYAKVFSFMQNLGQICRFLWAISWTFGQYRGHLGNIVDKSLRAHSANVTIEHETKLK